LEWFTCMQAFVRVARLGSFSKAAEELEIKVSTVSRHVSALEAELGAALFNRSTRGLRLTEAGLVFHARAISLLDELDEARAALLVMSTQPVGLLRVAAPGAFGRRHVVPHLKDFCALHPQIRLDLSLSEATVDLIETATDVAIRIGALPDSSLVARRLAPHERRLVASPAYLAAHGEPTAPTDLAQHQCLLFAIQPREDAWFHRAPGEAPAAAQLVHISGRFRANDSDALLEAARDGLGLALLPTWVIGEDVRSGSLRTVMPNLHWSIAPGPDPAIHGVYPPKKIVSPKVRAFLDFFAGRFGAPPYWDA